MPRGAQNFAKRFDQYVLEASRHGSVFPMIRAKGELRVETK